MVEVNVYEKLFEVPDIMSDAFRLFARHFHILPDIFLINRITMNFSNTNNYNLETILCYSIIAGAQVDDERQKC